MYKVFDRRREARKDNYIRMDPVYDPLYIVLIELVDEHTLVEALRNPWEHLHPDIRIAND